MHLDNCKSPLRLQAGWHLCPREQEDAGLAQGEPYGGVGGGFVLLALLTATVLTVLCGASLNYRSLNSFATNPMI
jgi:hypothetical protein